MSTTFGGQTLMKPSPTAWSLLLVLWRPAVAPTPSSPTTQEPTDCGIYGAALEIVSDSSPVVVVDSTAVGIPMFAFNAVSTPRSLAEQGWSLPDSVLQSLQTLNRHRLSLGECFGGVFGVQVVSDSVLRSLFSGGHQGWARFRARYEPAKRFVLVSRPLTLSPTSVLVYVAYAADWLDGAGALVELERSADGHWVKKRVASLWVS